MNNYLSMVASLARPDHFKNGPGSAVNMKLCSDIDLWFIIEQY